MQNRLAQASPDLFFGRQIAIPKRLADARASQPYMRGPIVFSRCLLVGDMVTIVDDGNRSHRPGES